MTQSPTTAHDAGLLDMMTHVLGNISFDNIDAACDQLLSPEPHQLDDARHDDVSSEYREHVLNVVDSQFGDEPKLSKIGQPAIVEDAKSHKRIRQLLDSTDIAQLNAAILVGEEAGRKAWDAAMDAPEGTMVIDVDPIDGSSNYDSMAFGFSTNILAYVKTGRGKNFQLIVAMVTGGHHSVAWQLGNKVSVRSRRSPLFNEITEPIAKVPRDGYISSVAAMPHHRAKVASLLETPSDASWNLPFYESGGKQFHDPTPAVYTMGGAPATIGLAIGRCSAAVTTSPQTIHDTAGVPAMLALNLPIFDASGPVDRVALMELFNQLDSADSDNYTPIPPLVIGRDPQFAAQVAERIFHSQPMDLIAVPRRPKFTVVDGGLA